MGESLELAVRAALTSQKKNSLGAWRYTPDSRDADTSVSGAVLVGLLGARNAGIEVPDEAIDRGAGIIINPAGLSFRSIPVLDALKMFPGPIIELHISNIHRREEIYQRSLMSHAVTAVIAGLGPDGYPTAVAAMLRMLATAPAKAPPS